MPRMFAYCNDESIVGTPFYLMEFLEGRVLADQSLPGSVIWNQFLYSENYHFTDTGLTHGKPLCRCASQSVCGRIVYLRSPTGIEVALRNYGLGIGERPARSQCKFSDRSELNFHLRQARATLAQTAV